MDCTCEAERYVYITFRTNAVQVGLKFCVVLIQSVYTLSDLGVPSSLIGSLSLVNEHC